MALKGAIFDLDGVIVNTVPLHFNAWKRMFGEYGKGFTFQDYKAQIGGYLNLMNLCYPELIIEECFVIAASNTAIDMRVYDWNECLDIYENQRRLFFDRLEVF